MKFKDITLEKVGKFFDVINKFVIVILIGAITSIFTWRSNIISDAIKQGEFEVKKMEYEQKLLEDFMFKDTSRSKYMRQDIALAILYDFLKDDPGRKEFLINISRIVAQDTSRKKSSFNNIPLEIIFKLNDSLGRSIQYDYSKEQEDIKPISRTPANLLDSAEYNNLTEIDTAKFRNFEFMNKLAGTATVFIQINDRSLNDEAEKIRQKLLNRGYLVPSIEIVEGNYTNSLRYFNSQDYTTMKDIIYTVKDLMFTNKIPDIQPVNLVRSAKFKAPVGQIEIWLSNVNKNH